MIYDARDCRWLRIGVLLASAVAWALIASTPGIHCACAGHGSSANYRELLTTLQRGSTAYEWLLMLVAMMAPMTLAALYQIRVSSFVKQRWTSSALFLVGYFGVWMLAGAALTVVEFAATTLSSTRYLGALSVLLTALVWQTSPIKQRCLNRCHSHGPLAAFGLPAARDALWMGIRHGLWCVCSCWAMMLLPMVVPAGHLAVMAAMMVMMFCERLDPPATPTWRFRGLQTGVRWVKLRLCILPNRMPQADGDRLYRDEA